MVGILATVVLTVGVPFSAANADGFMLPAAWTTFDPGANGVGNDPDGYHGVVFDERYLYFGPHNNGSGYHGEVLRYDTQGPFDNASSWETFDAVAGIGAKGGYADVVFDGQHVYFVPSKVAGPTYHGEVLRYDTTCTSLQNVLCWEKYDYGADPNGCALDPKCTDPVGYAAGAFDGRYVYFAPELRQTGPHGEILRYDTHGPFGSASSWDTFDVVPCSARGGYAGAVFDGQSVYFAPYSDAAGRHGEVLRYDTTAPFFKDCSSWEWYDYGETAECAADSSCNDPDGYNLPAFDGRYVYFSPEYNATQFHAEVLRYDTTGPFSSASSWETFDALKEPALGARGGYGGAVFDEKGSVYFVPRYDGSAHAKVLRYDTSVDFQLLSSWETFDAAAAPVGANGAYQGAVFHGRFVYFAPYGTGGGQHGEVLRYDALVGQKIPAVSEWGMLVMTLLVLTAGTVVLMRRRSAAT